LQEQLAPVQESFRALLALGRAGMYRRTATLCRELEQWWESL
jgi:hypothetical protein